MRSLEECHAYVAHMNVEHREIHDKVGRVRETLEECLNNPGGNDRTAEFAAELEDLRGRLEHHFQEEELGGCLEEAVSHNPHLANAARTTVAEHGMLAAMLTQIIVNTSVAKANAELTETVAPEFDRFARFLANHEEAENRILQDAFGCSIEPGE